MDEKDYWFQATIPGRISPLNWRGLMTFVALIAVLICATGAEAALRAQHLVLFVLTMALLSVIALGLAILIVVKTKPKDEKLKR